MNNSQKIFAWNGKGIALAYLNRYDEAIEAFEKSIDLNLKQGIPWNGKGLIFLRFNQFDKAIESFKKLFYPKIISLFKYLLL
jgi:tetratricopeptide (TPR) repeat protein